MTHFDRRSGAHVFTSDAGERRHRSGRLGGRGRGAGLVGALGVLGSAGVVVAARRLAAGIAVAVVDALVVLLGADEVGDCLGVFRRVGGLAVVADAAVGEGVLCEWNQSSVTMGHWFLDFVQLTESQVFEVGSLLALGNWRHRRGQDVVCDRHQCSADKDC